MAATAILVVVVAVVWLYQTLTYHIVAGPMIQAVGTSSFVVVWQVNRPGQGTVDVMDGEGVILKVQSKIKNDRHIATITGLKPGGTYSYRIRHKRDGAEKFVAGPWKCKTDAGPAAAFRFLAFGDSGTGGRGQYQLAEQMAKSQFDLVIHTGDLVYKRGEARDYPKKFFAPYAKILPSIPFMPVIGNHDYDTDRGLPLIKTFVLPRNRPKGIAPERHYWFDYGCARFVAVNADAEEDELRDRVVPWMVRVFKSAPGRWRFLYTHYPLYTGSTDRGPVEKFRKILLPALERSGVDVVFSGHNHLYERSKPILAGKIVTQAEGVVHVVTGAGGAELRPTKPRGEWADHVDVAYDDDLSFTLVDVSLAGLKLQQINRSGQVVDRWELNRPPRSSVIRKRATTTTTTATTPTTTTTTTTATTTRSVQAK